MKFLNKTKVGRIIRASIAMVLMFVWVFSPIVPVLNVPFSDEKIVLGIEISKAEAAYANGYEYRRSVTINESEVTGSADFTNFPVLMSFTANEFRTTGNGGRVTDAQGDDIIFTSDSAGSVVLDFEMERYNASTGEITAWVEVPTLDFDNNTTVYIFYGNSSVTTSQEDIPGTWDSNFVGVYHMDGSSSLQLDSASSTVRHDGTVSGATAGANGKVGAAYDFDGVNDVITVTDEAELDVTNVGTFEAWIRTDDINGAESNFSTWTARNSPTGGGVDDQIGIDSVIIGERVHYGAFMCADAISDFGFASSTLNGATFENWDMTKMTAPSGCGASEGGALGMDTNGVHVYYAALGVNGTTVAFQTATATPTYGSLSTWRNDADPTGAGASEGNSIDVVIVGDTAYYDGLLSNGTTETMASTSRTIGSGGTITWRTSTAQDFGGAANENCSIAVNSDGDRIYRSVYCSGAGTEAFRLSSTTLGNGAVLSWQTHTAPNIGGAADFSGTDMVPMGGYMYHAIFDHSDATESVVSASTSMAKGGQPTWISRIDGSSNPNGAAATSPTDIAVASDGKNNYYGAYASSSANAFFTASSSLPAHPFISKRNAYESIQVGTGFAFDWAGKPYTFGTSTNTTGFKHVVITQDGATLSMYENGVLRRWASTSVDFESNTNNLLIGGGHRSDGTSLWFNGVIDEVRISNTARSVDWIQTQYNNQNATSTFYTLGAEETQLVASISGTLYNLNQSEHTDAGRVIKARFGTSTAGIFSTTTIAGTGVWRITGIFPDNFYLGMPIHTWVDDDSTFRAFTFTKASSTSNNISGVDLYQNRVTVKHEGFIATSTTNTDLSYYDADTNSSLQFNATAAGALEVYKGQEFRITPGTEFAPGGSVTLHGNASTTNPDGDLFLMTGARQNGVATSSLLTLGANALTLAGNWFASSTSRLTTSGTITFNSTSTQEKSIIATSTPFSAVTFNSSGGTGSWTFGSNSATSTGTFTITAGTVTAPSTRLSIGGDFSRSGTFTHNSGTTTFNGTSAQTISSAMTNGNGFANIEFSGAGTKTFGTNAASTTNFYIFATAGAVTAPSTNLTVGGNFFNASTFTSNGGTVYMTGTANSLSASTTFRNLTFNPASAGTITMSGTHLAATGTLSVESNGTLSIGSGLFATSTDTGTVTINGTISGAGTLAVQNNNLGTSGTLSSIVRFAPPSTTALTMPVRTYGGLVEIFGSSTAAIVTPAAGTHTLTGGLNLLANGAGDVTFNGAANNPVMNVTGASGNVDFTGAGAGTEILWTGTGAWTAGGNVDFTGGTARASTTNSFTMDGASKTLTSNAISWGSLVLSGSVTLADNVMASSSVTLSGTVTGPGRTLTMSGTGATLVGGGNELGGLFISDGDTTLSTTDLTVATTTIAASKTLTIGSGRVLTATSTFTLNGTLGGTGTTTFGNASFACSNVPSGGTLSVNVRLDATGGNCTMPVRTYGANVEAYNNSAASARTVTPAAGTHTISGSLFVNAANSQNVTLSGSSNPTMNVTGNVDFTGVGAGTEAITGGTNNWDVNGSLDISDGSFTSTSGFLYLFGNYTNTGGVFTHNSGTTTFDGTSAQTINGTATGTSAFRHVEFSGGGSKTFNANASSTNFFINSGSGIVTAPTGYLSIAGHYNNSSLFSQSVGTTTINGTSLQTFSGTMIGAAAFANLELTNGSATTTFSAAASTTNNFYSVTPSVKVAFAAGATSTFQNLIINGQSAGGIIRLWSSVLGSLWNIHVPGTRSISYANVMDSDACTSESANIDAYNDGTNVNGGNNRCWQLITPAAILELLHYRWRADDGGEIGASAYAAEDTAVSSGVYRGDKVRLRYLVDNSGDAASSGTTFRLEHASSTDSYTYWTQVATTADGSHWITDETGFYLDGASSTNASGVLSNPAGSFTAGYLKSNGNQTGGQSLSTTQYTELEYVLRSNSSTALETNYRFRLTNAGSTATFLYTVYPQILIQAPAQRPQNGSPGGGEGNGIGAQQSGGGNSGGNGNAGNEGNGSGGQQGGGGAGGGGGGDSG